MRRVWAALPLMLACGLSEHPRPGLEMPGMPSGGRGGAQGGGTSGGGGSGGSSGGTAGTTGGGRGGSGGQAPSDARPPDQGGGGQGGRDMAGRDVGAPADGPSMPPPGPGGAISINGMQVPREKVLVFLHIGHSNMAGRVTIPESLRPLFFETHPRLWAYARGGTFRPAKEPLSADSMTGSCGGVGCSGLPAGAGPGMSILRAALAAAPDSYIVSIGRGQSGTTGGYCRSFRKGGLLYDFVMGPAMELKGRVTFAAVWTMLGLSEVNDRSNASRFGECMAGIASDMRGDLGEPDLPFVFGDWEEGAEDDLAPDSSTGRIIIPQLRSLPMTVPRSVVIPTDGLPMNPLDGHHYDLTGHKLWGERGVALLKMNGLAPWAAP